MNSVSSRLKAIAITVLFFALSGFGLLAAVWALGAVPFSLPGQSMFSSYRPGDTIAVLRDLRLTTALTAAFLVASAIVLALSSQYLDRMIAIFADVLLMLMGAVAGFIGGYWVMLRFWGQGNFIEWGFVQAALIAPAVVFGVSLIPPHWARSSWPLRIVLVLALLVAAPIMLVMLP